MLESDKRYLPNGGNGLQFSGGFKIPAPKTTLNLDPKKIEKVIKEREKINKLMGS